MKGSELVIKALQEQGVDTVFGYPGGAIMPIYDALFGSGVKHILCRHEQGAAFAAVGTVALVAGLHMSLTWPITQGPAGAAGSQTREVLSTTPTMR